MHGLNMPWSSGLKTLLCSCMGETLFALQYIEERKATKEIKYVISINAQFVISDSNNNRLYLL